MITSVTDDHGVLTADDNDDVGEEFYCHHQDTAREQLHPLC